jgi:hypothetical protein
MAGKPPPQHGRQPTQLLYRKAQQRKAQGCNPKSLLVTHFEILVALQNLDEVLLLDSLGLLLNRRGLGLKQLRQTLELRVNRDKSSILQTSAKGSNEERTRTYNMLQDVLLHPSKSGKLDLGARLGILARLNVLIPAELGSHDLTFKPLLDTPAGLLKAFRSLLEELKVDGAQLPMLILNNAGEIIASGGKLLIDEGLGGICAMVVEVGAHITGLLVSGLSGVTQLVMTAMFEDLRNAADADATEEIRNDRANGVEVEAALLDGVELQNRVVRIVYDDIRQKRSGSLHSQRGIREERANAILTKG